MNPGLLNLRIRVERKGTTTDSLGQPVEAWTVVGRCQARGMTPRDRGEAVVAERPTERRGKIFRVRSRPFLTFYQPGDRLVEEARADFPPQTWEIEGWTEVEKTAGMYVDISAATDGR
jgi:head-tail adaptor